MVDLNSQLEGVTQELEGKQLELQKLAAKVNNIRAEIVKLDAKKTQLSKVIEETAKLDALNVTPVTPKKTEAKADKSIEINKINWALN